MAQPLWLLWRLGLERTFVKENLHHKVDMLSVKDVALPFRKCLTKILLDPSWKMENPVFLDFNPYKAVKKYKGKYVTASVALFFEYLYNLSATECNTVVFCMPPLTLIC